MYINNQPFTEKLQMAQRDMYDIDVLLLRPLKKMRKFAKRNKIAWGLASGMEHTIGITFGILSIIEFYNHRYTTGGLYTGLMAIGATTAFNAGAQRKSFADAEEQLKQMLSTTQNAINISSPEELHEIAEIVRNHNSKQK